MPFTFLQHLQSAFGVHAAGGDGDGGQESTRWEPICLQRARLALRQIQCAPECLLVAERVQTARRLLRIAEQWAASRHSAADADEMTDYYSCLSERHAQEAADLILRARCATHN